MRSASAREVWRAVLGDLQIAIAPANFRDLAEVNRRRCRRRRNIRGRSADSLRRGMAGSGECSMPCSRTLGKDCRSPAPAEVASQVRGRSPTPWSLVTKRGRICRVGVTPGGEPATVRVSDAEPALLLRVLRRWPFQPAGLQRGPGRGGDAGSGIQSAVPILRAQGWARPTCSKPLGRTCALRGHVGAVRYLRAVHQRVHHRNSHPHYGGLSQALPLGADAAG